MGKAHLVQRPVLMLANQLSIRNPQTACDSQVHAGPALGKADRHKPLSHCQLFKGFRKGVPMHHLICGEFNPVFCRY